MEKAASGPPMDLSRIKCFSITLAPSDTAAIGSLISH